MTNTWQNQREDIGLQMNFLSSEHKGMHGNGARENANGKKIRIFNS